MEDETDIELAENISRGRRWTYWIFGTASITAIALLGVAYWQRTTIADRFVRDQLKKYGVQATYKIKDIGLRTQQLEDVVIGDPMAPDLIIKTAEIDLSINFSGATLRDVRVSGVLLKGKYDGEKLSFGELDKFSDPKNKKPLEIPDIGLTLRDAGLRMETPWGMITAGLDGQGLLRQKFEGNLALRAPNLAYENCAIKTVRFDGRYIYDSRRPNLIGPISADSLACPAQGIAVAAPILESDVRLSQKFDRWFGNVNFSAKAAKTKAIALSRPRGVLQFDGGRERTNFEAQLSGGGYNGVPLKVNNVELSAVGRVEQDGKGLSFAARGDAVLTGSELDQSYLAGVDTLIIKGKDTPVGPLLARIGPALRSAAANFDGRLRYDGSMEAGGSSNLIIDGLSLLTRSGARINQSGIMQLKNNAGSWALASPVSLDLSGGALPSGKLALRRSNGNVWAGELAMNEYSAGGSKLAISKLTFAGRPGGAWNFDGRALLTGPLQGGYVNNLNLPINARWDGRNISLYQSCQTLAFDGVKYADLILGKQSIRLCPNDAGNIFQSGSNGPRFSANIPDFKFNGVYAGQKVKAKSGNVRFNLNQGFVASNVDAEYGNTPIHIRTPILRFNFGKGFYSSNIKVEIGKPSSRTAFDIANLNGRFDRGAISGTLGGANGTITKVPLILSNAAGQWSYQQGALAFKGALGVSDAEQVDRFLPMNVPDASVILRNGLITAQGSLIEPATGRTLSGVDIRHMLSSGAGGAVLSVKDLKFDDILQPEKITPLTLGVVANTRGTLNGTGYINWSPNGVKSNGKFVTKSLDVAAGFGPVERLQTEIEFTDLLAFETGPGQVADIGSINPGIPALEGKIRYQLLPGKRVGIEGGRWPFAGGELILEPTVINFGVDAERRLTFRVVGLDSAKFLQQYDFDNMQVSGIFDGTLPMVFNQAGGRIVGGSLVARKGGGEVSYVGQISYENMGVFANYAFSALRSIRYNDLTIGINGDLGGEIITEVSFSGLQQGTGAKRNFITKQLAKIPIQFNVRITAQFLQLIGSIRGIYDSKYASELYVPKVIDRKITAEPAKSAEPVKNEEPLKSNLESKPKDE